MAQLQERFRELLQRIRDWWNRFTVRQRAVMVGGVAVGLLTVIILITVMNRPKYVLLMNAVSTKESNEVVELLSGENIKYRLSEDALRIEVLKSDLTKAELLLGANDIQAVGYSIDNVTNGSFSTTESDKQKKYVLYLESRLEKEFIECFDAVESAHVELNIPQRDGTLVAEQKENSVTILLKIKDGEEFTEDNASFLARAVATAVGNKTTENIEILTTEGNMLFSGSSDSTASGNASTQLTARSKVEQQMRAAVSRVLMGTNVYDKVEVAPNLVLDFSSKESVRHNYTPAEGQNQGVLSHEDVYEAENVNGVTGIPGTDTNNDDETTYVFQDNENSKSTVTEESRDYLPNEYIETITTPPGLVVYDQCSISVTGTSYLVYNQDTYKPEEHDGLSWKEFKDSAQVTQIEVPESLIDLVSKASGIAPASISMTAYSQPVFFDSTGGRITLTDVLQVILILLILGLLAFVIFRSMYVRKEAEEEEEEEPEQLEVEDLLESTTEELGPGLEDIEMDEGSETKRLIEKFIDENPEAAASLLRNWLNEDFA